MTLVRRGVALLDFVLFVKELFGSQYNSPKSRRVREVAASYAAYHDHVWMGHGEYDQLFQGEYGTFVRFGMKPAPYKLDFTWTQQLSMTLCHSPYSAWVLDIFRPTPPWLRK